MLSGYLGGLPAFLTYFAVALAFLVAFGAVYSRITPHHEFTLIRQGNAAAVPAFLGALLGFALPLASAIAHSVNLVDFVLWALIAMVVQVLAFFVARLAMPDVSHQIMDGRVAAGAWLGGIALVFGVVNAACMTY